MTTLPGVWYNELGSKMTLTADKNGTLTGTYESAVGDAEGCYTLTGRFDASPPKNRGVSVGWAVTFCNDHRNANSTTTWSGQYFGGADERILTNWILTSSTPLSSVWDSTRVGHDTFIRIKPKAQAEIAQAPAQSVRRRRTYRRISFTSISKILRKSKIPGFCMNANNKILEEEKERNYL